MGVQIKSFRDLVVWQKAMLLVEHVYQVTGDFPSEERYGLTSQMRRSAVSVPSNIAEGYGRHSTSDYIRFLQIALGSLNEIQTQLELSCRLGYIAGDCVVGANELCVEVEKMLVVLISKLREKVKASH